MSTANRLVREKLLGRCGQALRAQRNGDGRRSIDAADPNEIQPYKSSLAQVKTLVTLVFYIKYIVFVTMSSKMKPFTCRARASHISRMLWNSCRVA